MDIRFTIGAIVLLTLHTARNQPAAAQNPPDSASVTSSAPLRTAPLRNPPDSLLAPLSPGRAFLRSMLLPGLGQARLRRQLPGAVYFTVDALAFTMLFRISAELRIAKARARDHIVNHYRTDPVTGAPVLDGSGMFVPVDSVQTHFDEGVVDARRGQFEDWVAIIVFNHLFAGADAFVSSLLWDLPARVGFRPAPAGIGAGISIRW